MSIALSTAYMVRDTQDSIKLGFKLKGDEYLHWYEDTTGNPVVMDKDNHPHYADWDATQKKFIPTEPVTKESRRRHLRRLNKKPSAQEVRSIRIESANNIIAPSSLGNILTPTVIDSSDDEQVGTVSPPVPLSQSPGVSMGAIKRPIMVIYVRFAADSGASIPDSYLKEIVFDTTKFGTLAHYFHTQFKGAVQFVNLGIYHVTLPGGGSNFGNSPVTITAIWLPVIEDLFTKQGVDFRIFGTTRPDPYGWATNRIDRASCTPIIILHGQEEAVGGTGSCSVWGHAYRNGTAILIGANGHPTSTTGAAYHLKNAAIFGAFHGSDYFNLGIIAHECGHALFDLPDLYDTDTGSGKDSINGFGVWSLMGYQWTNTLSKPQAGSVPPNMDGFSIQWFNKKFAQPVSADGPKVIDDPYTPHVIRMDGVSSESFILQTRSMEGYDAGPAYFMQTIMGTVAQPGVLIMHYNPGSSSEANLNASDMIARIEEAHGGIQNLRMDTNIPGSGFNYGDPDDLFGPTNTSFGDSVPDPNNILLSEQAGRKGLFDITDIRGNSDGTGSYNIVFNPVGGTYPDWESLPNDPENPNNEAIPDVEVEEDEDEVEDFDENDPYRHAIRSGVLANLVFNYPVPYPFNRFGLSFIAQAAINRRTGALTVADDTTVFTASAVYHRLVSRYKNRQIGEGIDIYIGKVIRGIPKVVEVQFFNEDMALAQMHTIKIEIVASADYPYYALGKLSLDGTTWTREIVYTASQLLSMRSGASISLCSFKFFAKIETDTTVIDPKPIRVKTTYTRVLP